MQKRSDPKRNEAGWRASAAYVYTLRLDGAALAWEYLRRNLEYCEAWNHRSEDSQLTPARWHLTDWVDPHRDARMAEPCWQSAVPSVSLVPHRAEGCARPFGLWRFAGRKQLSMQGEALHLSISAAGAVQSLTLDRHLSADEPFAFVIPANERVATACGVVRELAAIYGEADCRVRASVFTRAYRTSSNPACLLQALDGLSAGASHRDIAGALYGDVAVRRGWSADGDLRARVRYLIGRARAMSAGGYRDLLATDLA